MSVTFVNSTVCGFECHQRQDPAVTPPLRGWAVETQPRGAPPPFQGLRWDSTRIKVWGGYSL